MTTEKPPQKTVMSYLSAWAKNHLSTGMQKSVASGWSGDTRFIAAGHSYAFDPTPASVIADQALSRVLILPDELITIPSTKPHKVVLNHFGCKLELPGQTLCVNATKLRRPEWVEQAD